MKNVLSIDFDYFFEEHPTDEWGHREAPVFIRTIWPIRAANLYRVGIDPVKDRGLFEPPVNLFDQMDALKWSFARKPKVAVAESHGSAFHEFEYDTDLHIVNVDAHHDLFYGLPGKVPSCQDWLWHLVQAPGRVCKITIVYPKWRRDANHNGDAPPDESLEIFNLRGVPVEIVYGIKNAPRDLKFERAFIARSGAWVPPWLDDDFDLFVKTFLTKVRNRDFTCYTYDDLSEFKREIDLVQAKTNGDKMREVFASMIGPKGVQL